MTHVTSTVAARAALTLALVGALGAFAAAGPVAADDDTGGIGISIVIKPTTPTPTPTQTTTTTVISGTPGGSTGSNGSTTVTSGTPVSNLGTVVPLDNQLSLGGVVFLSGLTSSYQPSINPLAGTVTTSFTVRNVSDDTFDSSATFWITNPFGATLGEHTVSVAGLGAGETRVVSADIPGAGQWSVLTTHMTFTPPAEVDGVALVPVTRDAMAFAAPWLVSGVVFLGAGAAAIISLLRRPRGLRLSGAPA